MYNPQPLVGTGPGDLRSIPGWVIPKTQKMVLYASLLNTQHYKVRIKGKVEKSWERSSTPLYLGVVAIEKGAFGSPSTKVTNLYIKLKIIMKTKTKKIYLYKATDKQKYLLIIFIYDNRMFYYHRQKRYIVNLLSWKQYFLRFLLYNEILLILKMNMFISYYTLK